MVLNETSADILSGKTDTQGVDILLETIVQVQTSQSRDLLNKEAEAVISHLIEAYCDKKNEAVLPSDYAFTIELAAQLFQQTLTFNKKKSVEESSETRDAFAAHTRKALAKTKELVAEVLAKETVDSADPFNEFMAAGKGKRKGSGEDDDDDEMSGDEESKVEAELLPSYQILLSMLSLLTRAEAAKTTELTSTAQLLKEVSVFVAETSTRETRQVTKQKELT